MSELTGTPRFGAIVERTPGQQQMVLAVYPPVEESGIPWRVWLAGDPSNRLGEWPWLVGAGMVVQP